jgi:uncharacterized phage infection (PIP) family protein YhgE
VQEGVELVNKAGEALAEIVASIRKVATIVSDIATASEEQATGIGQVNIALNQMDEVTQQNSALVEENASAAKSLEEQSAAMDERVSFFHVGAEAKNVAVMPKKAARPNQTMTARRPVSARGGRVQGALAAKIDDGWEEF